jgi:hypothetical protein
MLLTREKKRALLLQVKDRLGLGSMELAQLLRISTRTLWTWETGKGELSHIASDWLQVVDLCLDMEEKGRCQTTSESSVSLVLTCHGLAGLVQDLLLSEKDGAKG